MSEQPTPADLTDEIVLAAAKAIQHEREHRWEGRVHQGDCIVDARAALEASRAAGFGPVRAVEAERDAAQEHIAYHLRDFRPSADMKATGDLAVDMVAYADRLKRRAEQAEARERAMRESVEAAERRMRREGSDHAAGILRDLLATSPDREGSDQ